jgi:hypothetical protein
MNPRIRGFLKKLWKPGVAVFYALIMLEGLWMVSAFGIYLYSVFGPAQSFLEASPATRWLTDFYLSHFVEWSSPRTSVGGPSRANPGLPFNPFRLNVYAERNYFWFVGFAIFFIGALQIYHSKVTKRGAVTTGLYRYVRHPQYIAFMIVGLPFVVSWPRFLLLVSYATMAYFYLCLALREESLCVERYGKAYEEYRDRTSMFLPGDKYFFGPVRRWVGSFVKSRAKQVALFSVLYVVFMLCVVGAAYGFRRRTAALVPYEQRGDVAILALQGADRGNIRSIADIILADPRVQAVLQHARPEGSNQFLIYILARGNGHHFLRDHFAETRPRERWTGKSTPAYWVGADLAAIPREDFRMVLCYGIRTTPFHSLAELLERDVRPIPLVMLGVDLRNMKVLGYVDLQKKYDPRKGSRMPLV